MALVTVSSEEMGAVNHFKMLMDKQQALLKTSSPTQVELKADAELKSFRTVKVVLREKKNHPLKVFQKQQKKILTVLA